MRQLAGTKNDIPEGSRHSARRTHFWAALRIEFFLLPLKVHGLQKTPSRRETGLNRNGEESEKLLLELSLCELLLVDAFLACC